MSSQKVFESLRNRAYAAGRHIFGYVQWGMKSRSRSANNTSIAEIMSWCKLICIFKKKVV